MSPITIQPSACRPRSQAKPPSRNKRRAGFALLISLSLMSFVLIIVLSMVMMTAVETANAANSKERLLTRENARLGMLIALGELQKHLGPDQRVTARGEIEPEVAAGAETWTGVWDTSSTGATNIAWLVSGVPGSAPSALTGPEGNISTIFPDTDKTEAVRASWIQIEGNVMQSNKFAYWVQDENVKARLNLADRTPGMAYLPSGVEARQDVREQISQFPTQTKVFPEFLGLPADGGDGTSQPLDPALLEELGRMVTPSQIGLALPGDLDSEINDELLSDRQHDFTTWSAGVASNPLTGGLKVNLTGRNQEQLDEILAVAENEDDHYLKGDFLAYHNIDPTTGEAFNRNANANNPSPNESSLTASGQLVRLPKEDFFEFRDDSIDPEDGDSEVVRNVMPVVSEASFRLGAFHTQSDTKHRIRFHADVEFWNPYPFPIRFPGESRDRVFTVMLVPSNFGTGRGRGGDTEQLILSVEKLSPGGGVVNQELHTNLFNFDEDLGTGLSGGGATNNTENETVMTSWMEIDNVILEPGEIYHATTSRGVGLARDLGGYILSAGGDPDDPADYEVDPDHDYNKWSWHTTANPTHPVFEANERVRVSLRIPENGVTFRLIPFDSRSTNNSPVFEENGNDEWSEPVWEFRNLYKSEAEDSFSVELNSNEYSRRASSGYTINDFTMGFHFKFDDEAITNTDLGASALSAGFDLRQPVWDYDDPAVKRAFIIGGVFPEKALAGTEPNPFDGPPQITLFFNSVELFADGNSDTHSDSFEQAIFFPQATSEPRSVGSFQHLPLSAERVDDFDLDGDGNDEFLQLKVGMPWSGELNEAYDKYFFSGAPLTDWDPGDPLPIPSEILTDADNLQLREPEAAGELLVKGSFNVNSLSSRAWAALISRTLIDWQYDGPANAIDLENAFLNLSNSTDAAIESYGSILEDSQLTDFDSSNPSASANAARLALRYPLRRLDNDVVFDPTTAEDDSLVEFLLDEMRDFFDDNGPFNSVSDFVNSGVLQRAIDRSQINGAVPFFSPAYITQASILEPIAPFLTVQSDTFVVRSIGELENPTTGQILGQVICEAVVQRLPERVDQDDARTMEEATSNNNRFGRRFVIKNITWKDRIL